MSLSLGKGSLRFFVASREALVSVSVRVKLPSWPLPHTHRSQDPAGPRDLLPQVLCPKSSHQTSATPVPNPQQTGPDVTDMGIKEQCPFVPALCCSPVPFGMKASVVGKAIPSQKYARLPMNMLSAQDCTSPVPFPTVYLAMASALGVPRPCVCAKAQRGEN